MNNKNINIIILVVCFNFFGCAFKAKQSAPPESLYEIKQPLLVGGETAFERLPNGSLVFESNAESTTFVWPQNFTTEDVAKVQKFSALKSDAKKFDMDHHVSRCMGRIKQIDDSLLKLSGNPEQQKAERDSKIETVQKAKDLLEKRKTEILSFKAELAKEVPLREEVNNLETEVKNKQAEVDVLKKNPDLENDPVKKEQLDQAKSSLLLIQANLNQKQKDLSDLMVKIPVLQKNLSRAEQKKSELMVTISANEEWLKKFDLDQASIPSLESEKKDLIERVEPYRNEAKGRSNLAEVWFKNEALPVMQMLDSSFGFKFEIRTDVSNPSVTLKNWNSASITFDLEGKRSDQRICSTENGAVINSGYNTEFGKMNFDVISKKCTIDGLPDVNSQDFVYRFILEYAPSKFPNTINFKGSFKRIDRSSGDNRVGYVSVSSEKEVKEE
jgi:hypothetical protein